MLACVPFWEALCLASVTGLGGVLLGLILMCLLSAARPEPCAVPNCPKRRGE